MMDSPSPCDKPVDQAISGKSLPQNAIEDTFRRCKASCWCYRCCEGVVDTFVSAWVTLISDFGAPPSVQRGCANSIRDFVRARDELTYWDRAKGIVCFFKARFLNCDPPNVDGYVYGGAWKKWADSRMHQSNKNKSLWASTFKLKNAADRLSERAAVVTMHKHSKSVSRTFQGDQVEIEKSVRTIMPLLEQAAKAIADDYYSGAWSSPVAASNSACLESARSRFGQIGHFMERVFGASAPLVCPGIGFCGFGPQVRSGARPCSVPEKFSEKFGWMETSAYDYDIYLARLDYVEREENPVVKSVRFYEEVTVDGVRYHNSWFETFFFPDSEQLWMNEIEIDAYIACDREEALAKVAAVLEPFKVRIITKGEAALQYVSTFFQQSAFRFNATVPCFRLVGKAPSTLDLIDLRQNAEGVVQDPVWASSDFSGASDGTAGCLRDCLMDCLTMHLPLPVRSLLRACNGDHVVSYPGPLLYPSMEELGTIEPVLQTLGTLMGEKTSFIILCYEVLVAHVSNRRRCGDTRPLIDVLRGVLINGDDRLAVSNKDTEMEFWSYCERYFGFKESKGKSYTHKSYANINSQSYSYDLDRRDSTPRKVPVRCLGLECGRKKLDEPFDPTCVITQILDGCWNSKMEWVVLQRFFKRFRRRIDGVAAGRNLFVHPSLGGLGNRLPLPHPRERCKPCCHHQFGSGWKVEVTFEQLQVAAALLDQPGARLDMFGPCGPVEDALPQVIETPWDVYGKPTYWNSDQFELKEMAHKYRAILDRLEKSENWISRLPTRSGCLRGRYRIGKSLFRECDRRIVIETQVWTCYVCGERNQAAEKACAVCLVPFLDKHETAFGNIVMTQFSKTSEVEVRREALCRVQRNVSLGSLRLSKLGYSPPAFDEFDTALYDHAIECARVELPGMPVVRYKGRAVDLFGENPTWAPLRPAILVW